MAHEIGSPLFTPEELGVLRLLVEKELSALKREGKKVVITNSPFLGKMERSDDLAFLKSEKLAQQFLRKLLRKLSE
mgnify:CR=1 FL=1